MKRVIMVLLMAVIVFAAASAGAETYTVKKGDCLSRIAVRHHIKVKVLHQANQAIKNPDLIYPGQELIIPEKGLIAAEAVAKAKVKKHFLWKKGGVKPFGRRNSAKAIKMFNLPEKVKEAFIAAAGKGLSEDYRLTVGQVLEQQIFGHYKMVNNVIVHLPQNQLGAKLYCKFTYDGSVYFLIRPSVCGNWAWLEKMEVAKPPAEEPPKVAVTPPPKKKLMMMLIPTGEAPVVAKAEIAPATEEGCRPEWESYAWAGHYWALEGGGQSNYYGGKANIFYCPHETSWGKMREGFGFTVNGWDGTNSGYDFRGNRWSVGPVVDLFTKGGSRFTTTLQLGKQRDRGHDGLGYEATQDTNILYFGQTADFYNVNKHVFKMENWLDAVIDIGHDKDSSWQGWSISEENDPAENKTSVSVGSRVYFWKTESFHGGLVGKGNYAFGDHAIGLEIGPFIADNQDIVKLGAGFRHQFNSAYETNNGNLVGVGIDLDIVKTIDKIVRYLRTEKKEEVK